MKKTNQIILLLICVLGLYELRAQTAQLNIEEVTFKSNSNEEVAAELGTFSIPENRSTNSTKTINLSFVKFKSTNPNPGYPIVYLAGGPGGSGIASAKGPRFKLFMALREIADVIALDQRGTGKSNQIPSCMETFNMALNEPGEEQKYLELMRQTSKKCVAFWSAKGIDVSAYNTRESANDLEDLRKVLGVEKLNLWGISYGSHLAFAYIKQYPQGVHKMVLTGLEGPDDTIKRPKYNQEFLEYLAQKVQEDELAKKHYPNLLKTMKTVLDGLEKQPVYTTFQDPRSGLKHKLAISKFDLQLTTSYFLLKNPEDSKKLPYLYKAMANGDFSGIAPMIGMLKNYAGKRPVQLMSLAMDVMSGVSNKRWEKIIKEQKTALLGRTTNFPFPDIGRGLGFPDLGEAYRKNPVSNVSALFFSGTLDGRTYLSAAKELVQGFPNASHVILDGAGHDLFMSTEKVESLMLNFFKGLPVSSEMIHIGMPEWVLPN